MGLLQDYAHCKLKTTHACSIAGRTQESMTPTYRHLYPKYKKGPKISQHVKKFVLTSLPPCQAVMNKIQASQSLLIYGNMHIWTTSHAGNQLSMDVNLSHCDQIPQEVFFEDDESPNDDNDTDDERITPSKDESEYDWRMPYSCYEHTITIIWWLNISQCSVWCSNSPFNWLISAACQMQPWVSLMIILSMHHLISVTVLSCTINKERLKIY